MTTEQGERFWYLRMFVTIREKLKILTPRPKIKVNLTIKYL